jgi:hypothetical protein
MPPRCIEGNAGGRIQDAQFPFPELVEFHAFLFVGIGARDDRLRVLAVTQIDGPVRHIGNNVHKIHRLRCPPWNGEARGG